MWRWLKRNIIYPVADFFSAIGASIRDLFTRADDGRAQYQAIREEVVEDARTGSLDAFLSVQERCLDEPLLPDADYIISGSIQTTNHSALQIPDNCVATKLPLDIFSKAMPKAPVPDTQVTSVMNILSRTGRHFHGLFQQELANRAIMKELWQAVIDDDRDKVVRLSNTHPNLFFQLLTQGAPTGFVIQSKYTFQKFDLDGENLFTAVVKRKQLEMIKTLLSCCKQFDENESKKRVIEHTKKDAISKWTFYKTITNPTTHAEEIVIPPEYADEAQRLIDVFKTERLLNGPSGRLSDKTEAVLTALFNKLIPAKAVKLDDLPDMELLYLAAHYAYRDNYAAFNHNCGRLSAVCIRLIGFIQSVLAPETADIICEGVANVADAIGRHDDVKISERARKHMLKSALPYYRGYRDLLFGLGRSFYVDIFGTADRGGSVPSGQWSSRWIGKIMSVKSNKFLEITRHLQQQSIHRPPNDKRS